MDCERLERVALDLVYDELDELGRAAAERHLGHCVRCRGVIAGMRATREVGALPLVEAPAGLEQRILDAERTARRGLPLRQRLGRVVSVLAGYAMRPQLAMAALLMLAIGSSLVFLRKRPEETARVMTERGAPEGESDAISILPVPTTIPSALAKGPGGKLAAAGDAAEKGKREAPVLEAAESLESEGATAFEAAFTAFRDKRFGEARRQFDEVAARGGSQAAEAALYAAQAAKMAEGCSAAAPLFDQVAARHPGTRSGYDATWEAASCYEEVGEHERARRSYQALLDDPKYKERSRAALAQLDSGERNVEVAARKSSAAKPAAPTASEPALVKPSDRPASTIDADTPARR